jgi:hypothetical protein
MKLLNFIPATTGELLFQFILRELYQTRSLIDIQSLSILAVGGRTDFFAEYFLGITAMNTLSRCVKKAERVHGIDDEALHHQAMVSYIQQTLGVTRQGDEAVDQLARLSLKAASDSKRPIKDAVKKAVRNGLNELPCYICGGMCRRQAADEKESIKYEHIWPASFGGNSVVENILPVCWACNENKDDMLLWHTGNLFSFSLKPDPSQEELKAISRREKIARYMRSILDRACEDGSSIKVAALALGPVNMSSVYAIDTSDAIDFSNFQFR